jgi:dihydrodipicolinate synthase/N-acetylneuraminate lyase
VIWCANNARYGWDSRGVRALLCSGRRNTVTERQARFRGIYPMLYAYFNKDGSLDRGAMARQVDACVANGAHGIAVLGLATEVGKLNLIERRTLIDWVAEDLDGRLPLAVTIAEPSVSGQIEFARAAAAVGAGWVILQPPAIAGVPEAEYVHFFGAVAGQVSMPIAIQNAPGLMAVSLPIGSLQELNRHHPNICLLKAEGPAIYVREVIEQCAGRFDVFNGYGGLQLPDSLRAGCAGLIPGADCFDFQARVYELMRTGRAEDEMEAERIHREILPVIAFLMTTIENLVAYGKRLAARRLGIAEVHRRAPSVEPSAFGMQCLERFARALGPLR